MIGVLILGYGSYMVVVAAEEVVIRTTAFAEHCPFGKLRANDPRGTR